MRLNLPRIRAQDVIESGTLTEDDWENERIYKVCKTAYGDEDLAMRAQIEAQERYVRRECEAERIRMKMQKLGAQAHAV